MVAACRRHCATAGIGDGGYLVAETLHDAFQIHGDDRLVLDDEHVGCGLAIDLGDRARQEAGDLLLVRFENGGRSEEHTSELQSLMRISYAVFCLNKKKN